VTTEIRTIETAEVDAWVRALHMPFLGQADDTSYLHWRNHIEPERTWVVVDGDRFVGTSCVFSRDVTLPGLEGELAPVVPITAVSGVGVHTTHHRQGLLRQMMGRMLTDGIERGEVIAGLLASEATIYGRFGFGWATSTLDLTLPRRTSRLLAPAPDLELELCDSTDAEKRIPALFDRLRRTRAGQVDRNAAYWSEIWTDPKARRGGASKRFFAIGEDGYIAYRATNSWNTSEPNVLRVDDLFGASAEVEAGLWQYLLEVDLVDTITASRPVDEPIRWRLEDPRSLAVTGLRDLLWIRVLDVPGALTARHYGAEDSLVLEVEAAPTWTDGGGRPGPDPAAGRWVLEASPAGSSCRTARSAETTEVRLGVAELGAALLGGQDLTSRAAAGRVTELVPGALARADAVFACRPAPFSSTGF
jgi:predicted acetyltransferase